MEIEQMRSNLIGLMKQFDKRWVEKYRAKTRDQKKKMHSTAFLDGLINLLIAVVRSESFLFKICGKYPQIHPICFKNHHYCN